MLKWEAQRTEFYIDPFNEGQLLTEKDCRNLCEQSGFGFNLAHLTAATSRQILLRMCRNLQAVYAERDSSRAEHLSRFIALLAIA